MLNYNKKLKGYSRQLRKDMTNAERLFWSRVRRKQLQGYQFYRQKIIGNYIVDFYCPKAKLVIEINGGQHYDDEEIKKDNVRDDYMRERRLTVLRFSDREVFENLNGVIDRINENLKSPFKKGDFMSHYMDHQNVQPARFDQYVLSQQTNATSRGSLTPFPVRCYNR